MPPPPPPPPKQKLEALDENGLHPLVNQQTANDVWWALLVFRFMNSLLVWTFFQPDEYFQSLEPAWDMAFGPQSRAWITWACAHFPFFILLDSNDTLYTGMASSTSLIIASSIVCCRLLCAQQSTGAFGLLPTVPSYHPHQAAKYRARCICCICRLLYVEDGRETVWRGK